MNQSDLAQRFRALHVRGDPVVLYNIWDAGSARAVAGAGAQAIATGSASVAGAHGYPDGEAIPLDLVERIVARIAASIDLPLSVDMEGAYAADPEQVGANVARMIAAGAAGCNFEDQVVGGGGLYDVDTQCLRIAAIRSVANETGIPIVVNARTDLFLHERDPARHESLLPEAIDRARAYTAAGADCFFVPGLADESLIGAVCAAVELPVNVIIRDGVPPPARLAELGVARISHGPGPFVNLMKTLTGQARAALGG